MNTNWNIFALSKPEQKAFCYIYIITLFAMSSLLLANVLYSDDYTRVTTGETLWNDNGRPFASFISLLLQLGHPLTDISPLTQLIAFALYALSAIYIGKIFKVTSVLLLTLCGSIFVINPLNLQNFTFVFDSLPMGLSILTATMAALSISAIGDRYKKNLDFLKPLLISSFFLFCTLCLYQAAIATYIVIFVFSGFVLLINGQIIKSLKTIFYSGLSLLLGLITYLPVKSYYVVNEYNLYHSETVSFSEALPKMLRNVLSFWRTIQNFFSGENIINDLFYLLFAITLAIALINVFSLFGKSNNKYLLIILSLLSISSLAIAPLGMMIFLKNPIFAPRTLMGFSTLVYLCCLFLSHNLLENKSVRYIKYAVVSFFCILILAFSNVSSTLGNVLSAQDKQDQLLYTILIADLGEIIPQLPISQQNPVVGIVNSLEYTYANTEAYNKYPLLKSINWYYLKTSQIQFYTKLETLGIKFSRPDYGLHVFTGKEGQFIPKTEAILVRPFYKVYFENNNNQDLLIVALQNPE